MRTCLVPTEILHGAPAEFKNSERVSIFTVAVKQFKSEIVKKMRSFNFKLDFLTDLKFSSFLLFLSLFTILSEGVTRRSSMRAAYFCLSQIKLFKVFILIQFYDGFWVNTWPILYDHNLRN